MSTPLYSSKSGLKRAKQIKYGVFLFVFIQEQPSEPGWHGTRALHCCLPTSASRPDLYCAASLRSHCTDLASLLHPGPLRCHHPPRHSAPLCLCKECPLSLFLRVQHTVPQSTKCSCPGETVIVTWWMFFLISAVSVSCVSRLFLFSVLMSLLMSGIRLKCLHVFLSGPFVYLRLPDCDHHLPEGPQHGPDSFWF